VLLYCRGYFETQFSSIFYQTTKSADNDARKVREGPFLLLLSLLNVNDMEASHILLWDRISECLQPSEREQVRRMLGWADVEKNAELLVELESLRDMFFDLRGQRSEQSHRGTSSGALPWRVDRQLLLSQINYFVSRLRRSSSGTLTSGDDVSPRPGSVDCRPGTAKSATTGGVRPGTAGSLGSAASGGSGGATAGIAAAAAEAVESVHGSLSVLSAGIESATRELQRALVAEQRALTAEVQRVESLLQRLADGEEDGDSLEAELNGTTGTGYFGDEPDTELSTGVAAFELGPEAHIPLTQPGPGASLAELRAYKAALQAEWLSTEQSEHEEKEHGKLDASSAPSSHRLHSTLRESATAPAAQASLPPRAASGRGHVSAGFSASTSATAGAAVAGSGGATVKPREARAAPQGPAAAAPAAAGAGRNPSQQQQPASRLAQRLQQHQAIGQQLHAPGP
jgi:hypothetical protein